MRVTDAQTGDPFDLDYTDELRADLDRYYARECSHPSTELRSTRVSGGVIHFRNQCQSCGELVGQAVGKSVPAGNVPPKDEELVRRFQEARKKEYETIIQRHVEAQKVQGSEWWSRYNTYLETPEWRAKRTKVLKRTGGLCEGCSERAATQVHHLTYAHVFEEFLFELVALCNECHERIHQEDQAGIEDEWGGEAPCAGCRWQAEKDHRQWCGQFEISTIQALCAQGQCGPKHAGFEPLKLGETLEIALRVRTTPFGAALP